MSLTHGSIWKGRIFNGGLFNRLFYDLLEQGQVVQTLLSLWRSDSEPAINASTGQTVTYPPMSTQRSVLINNGGSNERLAFVPAGCVRRAGERFIRNFATSLSTHTIPNITVGDEYVVTIAGSDGASATCSGAFAGTITIPASGRYTFTSGPKTASTTTLTLTISGVLTEVQVENVTGQTNKNPSEYVDFSVSHATSNTAGCAWSRYENGGSYSVNTGLVTEAQGALILASQRKGIFIEGESGNLNGALTDLRGLNAMGLWSHDLEGGIGPFNKSTVMHESNGANSRRRYSTGVKSFTAPLEISFKAVVKRLVGNRNFALMVYVNTAGDSLVRFNLDTLTAANHDLKSGVTLRRASITALSDGSYQLEANLTLASGTAWHPGYYVLDGISAYYDGDGLSKMQVVAQAETSPVCTSWTPLTSRSSDNNISLALADIGFDGTTSGSCSLDISFKHDFVDLPSTDMSILSLAGEVGAALLYHKANHTLSMFDGTTSVEASTTIVADTTYNVRLTWEVGSNMTIYVDDVQAGQAAWDDDWDEATVLSICKGYTFGAVVSNLTILDGVA